MKVKRRWHLDRSIANIMCWLIVLSIFTNGLEKALFGEDSNSMMSLVKNAFMLVISFLGIYKLFKSKRRKLIFSLQIKKILLIAAAFLALSAVQIILTGKYTRLTIVGIIRIIYPAFVAFSLLNFATKKQLNKLMKRVLFVSLLTYVIEVRNMISISNIMRINFLTSYSPFESAYSAGTALTLFFYFYYKERFSLYSIVSLIFVIGTFKRWSIVFCVFLILISFILDEDKMNTRLPRKWLAASKILFIVIPLVYYYLITDGTFIARITGQETLNFTMGRSAYLKTLSYSGFRSYGYNSIVDFLGYSLEMELISIFIELGILGLVIFVWLFWDIAGNKVYSNILMLQVFVNFVTSHSLGNTYAWVLRYLLFGYIVYLEEYKGRNSLWNKISTLI